MVGVDERFGRPHTRCWTHVAFDRPEEFVLYVRLILASHEKYGYE